MSSNPEPGSTAPAAGSQPPATPSESATGTNAGGDKTKPEYDPKSFGAGVTKAKAEAQAKIDELTAKLAEREKAEKDAAIQGKTADELRKELADREAKLDALSKQADSLKGHVTKSLERRLASIPEDKRAPIKALLESGQLGTAETMLDFAESLLGSNAPVKSSGHAAVKVTGTGAYDWETHDRLHAESWKDSGIKYREWIEKNPMPKR